MTIFRRAITLFTALLFIKTAGAQTSFVDTLKVMTYNVNNYGFTSSGCPLLTLDYKTPLLRAILRYTNPDILDLQKMASSSNFVTDYIVDNVLDSVCANCYLPGTYTNNSGYTKANNIYFKKAKLGLVSTTTIYSADNSISDINLYKLYYKSPDLATTHDTIFLNIIAVHLNSGAGDASTRASEVKGAMNWLSVHITSAGNYIFMGDLNTQSSNESCFKQLITAANTNVRFNDPPNQLGDWSTNPQLFANYLTQSTRSTDIGDCGSDNTMNFRFDHILLTQPLMQGSQMAQYIPGTYTVIGQDGKHTGGALMDLPLDTAVPQDILNALYYMSEHLPVSLLLQISPSLVSSAGSIAAAQNISIFPDPANQFIKIDLNNFSANKYSLSVANSLGQVVAQKNIIADSLNSSFQLSISALPEGVYFLSISGGTVNITRRFVKSM